MFWWIVQNTCVAAALALTVYLVCRLGRIRPALEHVLWLVVLLKLVAPPLVHWPWNAGAVVADARARWLAGSVQVDNTAREGVRMRQSGPAAPWQPGDAVIRRQAPGAQQDPAGQRGNGWAARVESALRQAEAHEPARDESALVPGQGWDGWRTWLGVVWAAGAGGVLAWQVRRMAAGRRLCARGRPAPGWILAQTVEVARAMGIRPPEVLVARGAATPFVWCLGRPRLIWPEGLGDAADWARWRGVIVHELAHLKRRDHWVAWIELWAACACWFHPLFWQVRRRLRLSSELACDAWAVALAPDARRTYAETLLEVFQFSPPVLASAPMLGAGSGETRSFERRLEMIYSDRATPRLGRKGLLVAGVLALAALPCWSLAQDAAEPPREATQAHQPALPAVAVHDNRVYLAEAREKTIRAIDAASGKLLWQTRLNNWDKGAKIIISDDELHVQGEEGVILHKLNPRTGEIIESKSADGDTAEPESALGSEEKRIIARMERELFGQGKRDALKAAELNLRRARQALEHSERMVRKGYATQLARDAAAEKVEQAERQLANAKAGSAEKDLAIRYLWPAAGPNGLVVSSTDTEALDRLEELIANIMPSPQSATTALDASRQRSGGLTGLVELGTAYIEAVGERDLARGRLSGLNELKARDAVSPHEVSEAEQRLVIAERKVELLTMIIDAAGSAAETELEELTQQFEAGRISRSGVAEAEMRLKILRSLK